MAEFGLYWWQPLKKGDWINLGDAISPLIVAHVTGRIPVWASLEGCDGIAIGSVFHPRRARSKKRQRPLVVWGSGTLEPSPAHLNSLSVDIRALRGPKTASQIEGLGDVPFGDPGLFVAEVWPKVTQGHGKIALIPHHSMLKSASLARLVDKLGDVVVIDFTAPDIAASLQQLSGASRVISSSLHGLILADAYGVPSLFWNELGAANEWKFQDYFEGVGREDYAALTAQQIVEAKDSLAYSCLSPSAVAQVLRDLRAAAADWPEGSH